MDVKRPIHVPHMHSTGSADVKYEMVADDKENDQFVSVSSMGYFLYSTHNYFDFSIGGWCLSTHTPWQRT